MATLAEQIVELVSHKKYPSDRESKNTYQTLSHELEKSSAATKRACAVALRDLFKNRPDLDKTHVSSAFCWLVLLSNLSSAPEFVYEQVEAVSAVLTNAAEISEGSKEFGVEIISLHSLRGLREAKMDCPHERLRCAYTLGSLVRTVDFSGKLKKSIIEQITELLTPRQFRPEIRKLFAELIGNGFYGEEIDSAVKAITDFDDAPTFPYSGWLLSVLMNERERPAKSDNPARPEALDRAIKALGMRLAQPDKLLARHEKWVADQGHLKLRETFARVDRRNILPGSLTLLWDRAKHINDMQKELRREYEQLQVGQPG